MSEEVVDLISVDASLRLSIAEEVLELWAREGVKIKDPEARLEEVVMIARSGDELVGIASAGVVQNDIVNQSLYELRTLVGSTTRQQGIAYQLYQATVELLEDRFDAGDDIRGIGVFVEVEAGLVAELEEAQCAFAHSHSKTGREIKFNLVGVAERGFPQYIYYFENASLFDKGPVQVERNRRLEPESGTELRYCWGQLTLAEQQQIVGLWLSFGVIKDREACLERLPQVAAIALEDEQIVAVSSVFPSGGDEAPARFLGFRSFVSPDAKGTFIATKLLNLVYDECNQRYPEDASVKDFQGVAYLLQNDGLNQNVRMARGPDVKSCLAGYINNLQFRTKYFDGATIVLKR